MVLSHKLRSILSRAGTYSVLIVVSTLILDGFDLIQVRGTIVFHSSNCPSGAVYPEQL